MGLPNPSRVDLLAPQLDVVVEEEFVELRRLHRCSGQHRMHLAAMVDLVDEQMRQQVADALGNPAVLAPVGDDAAIEIA